MSSRSIDRARAARAHRAVLGLVVWVLSACGGGGGGGGGSGGPPPPPPPLPSLALEPIAAGLTYPIFLTAPQGDTRVFVVEKVGTIALVSNGVVMPLRFLDIHALVSNGQEQGLLGLAFAPDYATSGRFYVDYTNVAGDTVIARYRVSAGNPNLADAASAEILLTVDQIDAYHNGGMLAFGPDGYLYVGMGDGNGLIGGDASGTAQSLSDELGSLLRIDVSPMTGYAVPPDNPYVGTPGAVATNYCLGLRNPWRFSFDRATGVLYLGDVGQNVSEEIDVLTLAQAKGANFGWNIVEGDACHQPPVGCNMAGLVAPVLAYPHTVGRCAVIGGYVYRGAAIPALQGTYFFADLCTTEVSSFRYAGGQVTELQSWSSLTPGTGELTSFGEDGAGELCITSDAGVVFRVVED